MGWSSPVEYEVVIHREAEGIWAEVTQLPGCFASGANLDELVENLREAIALYLSSDGDPVELTVNQFSPAPETAKLVVCSA